MAIVITNGSFYITYSDNGATRKTVDINLAYQFPTVSDAIKGMKNAEAKTKNYYVFDTMKNHILWKRMTQEELIQAQENKVKANINRCSSGRIKRKNYSKDTRKLIYLNAGGRCELCGREILFEDMTIDHVNPLSMGGEDVVENLACVCYPCNLFKGNILPSDFLKRITDIFMYQMEKKNKGKLYWKFVHRLLEKMV